MWIRQSKVNVPHSSTEWRGKHPSYSTVRVLLPQIPQLMRWYLKKSIMIVNPFSSSKITKGTGMKIALPSYMPVVVRRVPLTCKH